MTNDNSERPTLKTIAEITGLSLSTVSLSLRDGARLKKSTNDMVAKAAAQVGYIPNTAGVRLRTGRTNILTLILSTDENSLDFTRSLIKGISSELRGSRYHLNVIPEFDPDDPVLAVKHVIENGLADGVILTHTSADDPRVKVLLDAQFPFVTHGRTKLASQHAYHDFPAEQFIEFSVNRLLEKKRTRHLLIAIDNGTTYQALASASFKKAINDSNVIGDVISDPSILGTIKNVRELAHRMVDDNNLYDGIICNSEVTALAILGGLQDKGVSVGAEFDLVCRQTSELLPLLYPNLDTVGEDLFTTGGELARLLVECIDGSEVSSLQTMHEPITYWRS